MPTAHLERYLTEARITSYGPRPTQGTHPPYTVILEGCLTAMVKFEDDVIGAHDGGEMVRREVAAWVVADALGWRELVPVTVLRRVSSRKNGSDVWASVQILCPFNVEPAPIDRLSQEDIWRAAVFDAVVGMTDRSHNFMSIDLGDGGHSLRLIDHGNSFELDGWPVKSAFIVVKQGHPIPGPCLQALGLLRTRLPGDRLVELVGSEALGRMRVRLERLINESSLVL